MDKDIQLQIENLRELITIKQGEIKKFNESKVLTVFSGTFAGGLVVSIGASVLTVAGVEASMGTNVAEAAFTLVCVSMVPLFIESRKAMANEAAIKDYNRQILALKQLDANLTISNALGNSDLSDVSDEVIDCASKESLQSLSNGILNDTQVFDDGISSEQAEGDCIDSPVQEGDFYSHGAKKIGSIY